MDEAWTIERLAKRHDRRAFRSGNDQLDDFLANLAGQYGRRRLGTTYVAVRENESTVLGYYAAAASALDPTELSESIRKKLPEHPLPTILLGRLAVDRSMHGRGLGKNLMFDCFDRVRRFSESIAVFALDVHAADEKAHAFYRHFGFIPMGTAGSHLYLPTRTIDKMLGVD
jgi:GNAT superfamily N-acetyltransferase